MITQGAAQAGTGKGNGVCSQVWLGKAARARATSILAICGQVTCGHVAMWPCVVRQMANGVPTV